MAPSAESQAGHMIAAVRGPSAQANTYDSTRFLSPLYSAHLLTQPSGCIIAKTMNNHAETRTTPDADQVFKALADSGRRLLLDRLRTENGQTLGQLCEHLDMTRQAVTKRLKVLEAANMVVAIWRGREKFHFLNPVPIHDIAERWIGKFEQGRLRALTQLKK